MSRVFWLVMAILGIGLLLLVANHDAGSVAGMSTDAFGSALYYGIWGLVLGAAILASGIRFGAIARNLAIWAAIILVLMVGYQFRYELQDVGSRLTAGLIPGSPISMIDDDGRAAVMLERLSGGHFEARGEVNGSPVRFLIDTGATATVLTAQDARTVGFDPDTLSFSVPILTANGQAQAARATADEVRVGEIARRNVPVLVVADGQLDRSLLGMNFIGTLSGFDMRGERLILRD